MEEECKPNHRVRLNIVSKCNHEPERKKILKRISCFYETALSLAKFMWYWSRKLSEGRNDCILDNFSEKKWTRKLNCKLKTESRSSQFSNLIWNKWYGRMV